MEVTPHRDPVPGSQGVFLLMLASSGGSGGNVDIATGMKGDVKSPAVHQATASSEESDLAGFALGQMVERVGRHCSQEGMSLRCTRC